jgi:hypothetical protein
MPNFRKSFPEFAECEIPPFLLSAPWTDDSWHNDACPSFVCGAVKVFVDASDPKHREVPWSARFGVCAIDGDGAYCDTLAEVETIAELQDVLASMLQIS